MRNLIIILFVLLICVFIAQILNDCNRNNRNNRKENYAYLTPNTALNVLYTDKYGNLNKTILISPGTIALWKDPTIPLGWAVCDGTQGTPDLRNRFVYGYKYTGGVLDSAGGTSQITITEDNLPSHTHNATTTFNNDGIYLKEVPNHTHTWGNLYQFGSGFNIGNGVWWFIEEGTIITTNTVPDHTHNITVRSGDVPVSTTIDYTGQNTAYSNLPPYMKLYYIMKL